MKKKILVFGASNSQSSINQKFAEYTAAQLENVEFSPIDLNDYEMPIFSVDREKKDGIPELANEFLNKIKESDGIIISFAEHNGNYTVAYKNISDWISRIELKTWQNKPTLLLATSPGGRGAMSVLELARNEFPRRGAKVVGSFSLPKFYNNFSDEEGIIDETVKNEHKEKISLLSKQLY